MDVKNQHYVPRAYLANFVDHDAKIWVYDKIAKRKFQTGLGNVAAEKYFYDSETFKQVTGDKQFVEKKLADLEGNYAEASRALIQSVESRHYNGVSKHLRHFFAVYMIVQMVRTKEHRLMIREMAEIMDKGVNLWRKENAAEFDGVDKLRSEEDLDEHAREAQLAYLLDGDVIREMAGILNKHVWIVQKAYENEVFLTSDNPFAKRPHGKVPGSWRSMNGISSKGIEIVFPLSSRYHLTLYEATHFPGARLFEKKVVPCVCTDNMVYSNQFQVTKSGRFVFGQTDDFSLVELILSEEPHWGDANRKRMGTSWDERLGR